MLFCLLLHFQTEVVKLTPFVRSCILANIFDLLLFIHKMSEIKLKRSVKQLKQDLKAKLGNTRVVAAFTALITDESMLCP